MKTQFQYEVISRLKKLREEKNYTHASIAKLLEISPGQLGNIESIFLPEKEGVKTREVIEAIIKYQEKSD